MTRSEKINISVVLLVLFAILIFISHAVYISWQEMRTRDRIAQIEFTLSRTLYRDTYDQGYALISEFRKQFPDIKLDGDRILDVWHHPIHVDIRDHKDRFEVVILSLGSDGKAGTEDDIIEKGTLTDINRKPEKRTQ